MAMADGVVVRHIREEMQVGKRIPAGIDTFKLSYPAASADQARPPDRTGARHRSARDPGR
jgi:hypothetical protein